MVKSARISAIKQQTLHVSIDSIVLCLSVLGSGIICFVQSIDSVFGVIIEGCVAVVSDV